MWRSALRRRARPKIYDNLNVTPLLDLAWVLLLVFMIMATAAVQGISVNLPKASAAPGLSKPKTKAITIAADGRLFLDSTLVSLPELEQRLKQLEAADPDLPVAVRGDSVVQYEQVMAALDIAKRAHIDKVGLVTRCARLKCRSVGKNHAWSGLPV